MLVLGSICEYHLRTMWYRIVRFFLFCLPPEWSHRVALWALDCSYPAWRVASVREAPSACQVWGLSFPNPVGLAAGLDKNGDHMDALFGLGFGFLEVGAVTPRPQPGHAKPRLFRLPADQALVNRMGFNNLGVDHLVARLKSRKVKGIVGVNIGKNADTPLERAHEDYMLCYRAVYPYADFVTVNISSPNTLNLRTLQSKSYLSHLLTVLKTEQRRLSDEYHRSVPLLVKIAPDLTSAEIDEIVAVFMDCKIDGIVATNTRLHEMGGLSGRPLRDTTRNMVREIHAKTAGSIPIVAVGGIFSASDAQLLLDSGASLVQIYTGLIYEGPGLVSSIIKNIKNNTIHRGSLCN